ncbi:hypothetical protein Tco_0548317 [Tanacetum coccineum]
MVFHNEDGNPARANIKQALGYLKDGDGDGNSQPHKGVKASANSDVMYFFTSAQDGDPSQDDVRLCLGDDLKKAQDHSQRQASNQGKSTKRRRHDSGASGSAQPPPKDSDASASKQHPTLTSTGWQITDTRDVVIDSSMHRSEPESGHSEHSSDDVSKQDEGHVSDLEDTDNAHIPKVTAATWFKPIPEDERPATPEP